MSSWERLRQNVGDLLLSADVLNVHLPISNTLPNEMKSHIYVFTSVVENRILTESYSRLAVHLQQESCALLALQLCKQLRQPYTLTGHRRPCNVLRFAGR